VWSEEEEEEEEEEVSDDGSRSYSSEEEAGGGEEGEGPTQALEEEAAAEGVEVGVLVARRKAERVRRREARRRAAKERKRAAREEERVARERRGRLLEGGQEREEEEEEWDGMLPLPSEGPEAKNEGGKKEGGRLKRAPAVKWDFKEDAALRQNYLKYKDSASVFFVLAKLPALEAKGRTAEQVKRRVKFLKVWDPEAGGPGQGRGGGGTAGGGMREGGKEVAPSGSSSESGSDSDSEAKEMTMDVEIGTGGTAMAEGREGNAEQVGVGGEDSKPHPQGASPSADPTQSRRRRIRKKVVSSDEGSEDEPVLDILGM
jgi:hypothetical protein